LIQDQDINLLILVWFRKLTTSPTYVIWNICKVTA